MAFVNPRVSGACAASVSLSTEAAHATSRRWPSADLFFLPTSREDADGGDRGSFSDLKVPDDAVSSTTFASQSLAPRQAPSVSSGKFLKIHSGPLRRVSPHDVDGRSAAPARERHLEYRAPRSSARASFFFTDISEHAGGKDRGGYSNVIGVSQRMPWGVQWATLRIAIAITKPL